MNADGMFHSGHELLGNNLYAYCANNPINCIDPDGQFVIFIPIVALLAKAVVITAAVVVATVAVVATANVIANVVSSSNNSKSNNNNTTTTTSTNRNTTTTTSTTNTTTRNTTTAIQSTAKPVIVQANRYVEPPSKLKVGDRVKTPDSHPNEFVKNKNGPGYTHNKTGWQAKPDPSNHGGPHWDMNPPRGSGHINVGPNGNIFGGSR